MISSDMEEVIGVCDRVAVMHEGRIAGLLDRSGSSASRTCCALAVGQSGAADIADNADLAEQRTMIKKDLGLLVLILVVGTVVAIINPRFLSPINISNTANLIGLFGIFAIAQAFVIITGGIELSVGSIVALLGVMFVDLIVNGEHATGRSPRHRRRARLLMAWSTACWSPGRAAALRRDAVRPADLSRHGALLHRGRHGRLRLRRRASRRWSG